MPGPIGSSLLGPGRGGTAPSLAASGSCYHRKHLRTNTKWWNSYRHYHHALSRRASYQPLVLVTLAASLFLVVPNASTTAVHMDDPAPLPGIPILRGDHRPRDDLLLDPAELKVLESASDLKDRINLRAEMLEAQAIRQARRALHRVRKGRSMKDSFHVYDCLHDDAIHKPISLLEPDICEDLELSHGDPTEVQVQVLQAGSSQIIEAYHCHVSVTRTVTRCGFDSLTYGTVLTDVDKPVLLTAAQCRDALEKGQVTYEDRTFSVSPNIPVVHRFYSHGGLSDTHRCTSASFVSGGVQYHKSFEQTLLRITISTTKGRLNPATGRVVFVNGLVANFRDRMIRDDAEGVFIWETKEIDCPSKWSEIYKGSAHLFPRKNLTQHIQGALGQSGDLVMIEDAEANRYAGLVLASGRRLCNRIAYSTQLPGVHIVLLHSTEPPLEIPFRHPDEMVGTQVSSNLGYVHLDRALHVDQRFAELQKLICENERKILFTKLHLISGSDSRAAMLDLYGPGHSLTRAGAAVYVTSCVQVPATIRPTPNCTQEIPIWVGNQTLFADPLTYVIQPHAASLPCDVITPIRYKINQEWVCAIPAFTPCAAPEQLDPTADKTSNMHDFTRGLGSGIFSPEQVHDHRLFYSTYHTREAVITQQTAYAMSNPPLGDGLGSPFSPYVYDDLTDHVGYALVPFFGVVGGYWSVLTGSFLIISLIRVLLNTLMRMYIIHVQRGFGVWMLLSLWESLFMVIMLPWKILASVTSEALGFHSKDSFPKGGAGNGEDGPPPYSSKTAGSLPALPAPPGPEAPRAPLPKTKGTLDAFSEGEDDPNESPPVKAPKEPSGDAATPSSVPPRALTRDDLARKKEADSRYAQLNRQMQSLSASNARTEDHCAKLLGHFEQQQLSKGPQ